eukprot:106092_1
MKRNIIHWWIIMIFSMIITSIICTLFFCAFKIKTNIYDVQLEYEGINIFDIASIKYYHHTNIVHTSILNDKSATAYNVNNYMIRGSTGVAVAIVINVHIYKWKIYFYIHICYQNFNSFITKRFDLTSKHIMKQLSF